jgi:hypothetical protein
LWGLLAGQAAEQVATGRARVPRCRGEVEVEAEVKLQIVGFVLLRKTCLFRSIFLSKALLDALRDVEVGCRLECAAKRKVEC